MAATEPPKDIVSVLESDDELLDAVKAIIAHEESGGAGTQYPWTPDDVGVSGGVLDRLLDTGIVTGPVGKYYRLADHDGTDAAVTHIEDDSPEPVSELIDEIDRNDVPDDLFQPIVGYGDIKRRFVRALESGSVRQSIILVGPRGSAKSVFIQEVMRLPRVEYMKGKDATVAGVEEKLLNNPNYVVVDEFDKLPTDVFDVFLNWQDPRLPFSVSKSQRSGEIENTGPVFATGNSTDRIPEPNMDRFWDFYFDNYSTGEFQEVCERLLPRDFGVSEDLARYIAKRLRQHDTQATVRDAERLAEVADTESDVDEEIELLNEYSK